MPQALYPLRFREILRDYGFGDRWIVDVYEKTGLPEGHRVAETWEVCDRATESSVVVNGPLADQTLHELIDAHGEVLLGTDVVARCGLRFPLLIKFLDASNRLSEQAHHSDSLAAERGLDDPGKTEAWYMLHVREGATVFCGNRDGATRASVRDAVLDGSVRQQMREYAVAPGDAFLLYAGTMHYSAGGVLFYEVMQNSDVYISLRSPSADLSRDEQEAKVREAMAGVHLEDGFDSRTRPVTIGGGANRRTFVYACRYFALERMDLMAPTMVNCDGSRFYVLSLIEGACTIVYGDRHESLLPGNTILLPAALGYVTVVPTEPCALLKTYVPDLVQDIVKPLRMIGVADTDIVALGGRTRLNDLAPLVEEEHY